MRVAVATVTVALALTGTGCGGHRAATTSRDCSAQVRVDGIVYTSYGYTDRNATRHAWAEAADCDDVGPDAAGPVFPDSPHHVRTWAFAAYSPAKVVGTRFGDTGSFAVFVADSVSPQQRDRILEDLGGDRR